MKSKKQKRKKITMIISIIVIMIIAIGISYAYYITQKRSGEQTIVTGVLDLNFTETSTLRLTNAIPIRDEDVENDASEINFTIENTGDVDIYTTINLEEVTMSDLLKTEDFNWALYENDVKVSTGNFSAGTSTYNIGENLFISASQTKRYTVRIWIRDTQSDQTSLTGSTFSAKVTATGYSINQ